MKQTMNAIVDVDQQGFIKGGDITGNLILVKEIIDYCNEEQQEGNMILMDFMKAYDRVDREAMFDTLTAMNYGDYFMNLIRILYTDATAIVMVNGEMADSFVTGGGVRQGCPLSPYLFIAVLELMAIALREDENYEGITEPDSKEVDKVSLFADDSGMFIHKTRQIRATRNTIRKFEKATGARLHDGKTKIMKMGQTRQENKTREEIGTEFAIMLDDEIERYLGEMIGNSVKDTDRHDDNLEAMKKTGERWNMEDITMIGRALVANTLLYSRIKFRLDVNSTTTDMRKRIKKVIKEFIWKKGKERVRWEVMTRRQEEGGIGVIDPDCMIDATKIMILKRWNNQNKQPWKKWITRRMNKKKQEWKMNENENVLGLIPTRKMITELRDDNLTEKIMKIWYEIEGTTRSKYENRGEKDKKEEEFKRIVEIVMKTTEPKTYELMMRKRKEGEKEIGIEIEGEWRPIETIRTKEIYEKLLKKRLKLNNYTPKQAHKNIKMISKKLTPKERDFWWRHTHELISIRKIENKWRKNEDGSMMTDKCAMCITNIEDRHHYEYGCKVNQKWREHVMKYINEMKEEEHNTDMTKDKWNLNEENMDEAMMVAITKARWIYQKARGKVMNKSRVRMDMDVMMNSLKRAMARVDM